MRSNAGKYASLNIASEITLTETLVGMYITLIINIYAIQFNSARSVFTSALLDRVTKSSHDT